MVELGVELAGVKLGNPLILAAGVLGVTPATLIRCAKSGAGAVTIKSIGPEPRAGHQNPTVLEWECGLINAVGLSTPGPEEGAKEVAEAVKKAKVPVIASFFAKDANGFGEVAGKLAVAKPAMLEANLSCPNTMTEFGMPFAYEPEHAAEAIRAAKAKAGGIPLIAKLSPNTYHVRAVARAVEAAGADAINMGNTLGPGMLIDIDARKPILANKAGGISGPAARPVAVRCVWDIYESVKIPIIGTGGVSNGRDALEMIMAGATAVGVGSAVAWGGFKLFGKIADELEEWMAKNNVSSVRELVGIAHR
jgi:dihydroorotate dehydrogenase (NAD+) catalytic subunit